MPGSEAWALGDFSRRSNPPPLGGGEVAQDCPLDGDNECSRAFRLVPVIYRLSWRSMDIFATNSAAKARTIARTRPAKPARTTSALVFGE